MHEDAVEGSVACSCFSKLFNHLPRKPMLTACSRFPTEMHLLPRGCDSRTTTCWPISLLRLPLDPATTRSA